MCVAFAHGGTNYDGTTFVGGAEGHILRFAEQVTDYAVLAHFGPNGQGQGKVTALYFCPYKHRLISSGDDGFLHMWDPAAWHGPSSHIRPEKTVDMNNWVSKVLAGLPTSNNDKEADKVRAPSACFCDPLPPTCQLGVCALTG